MKKLLIVVSVLALVVAGCAYPVGPREGTGTLLGAGTGALIGSQIGSGQGRLVAVALGTLAGALIGQDVGRTLDQADLARMQQNTQNSLETVPSNQTSRWSNPDSGHAGSTTPIRTFQSNGQYCREYRQTVVINGNEEQAYGTACRQSDGSWKVTSAQPQTQSQQVVVRERVVTPVYRPVYYDPYYYPRYYPYYPAYYWPFATSLSFSWVGHSGGHHGRHHRGYRGHGWRGHGRHR